MSWILIFAIVAGAWAMLRVLGGERQKQAQELEERVLTAAGAGAREKSSGAQTA